MSSQRATSSRRARIVAGVVAAVVLVGLAASLLVINLRPKPAPQSVAVTVPVPITLEGLPAKTKIGVVLTPGDASVPGAAFNQSAQGAVVAAQRLSQGGNPVQLDTKIDHGVPDGAHHAVQELAADKVAGIVIVSSGKQAQEAALEAQKQGIPAIMPYATPASATPLVWSLGADTSHEESALRKALSPFHNVMVVTDAAANASNTGAVVASERVLSTRDFDSVDALARRAAYNTGYVPGQGKDQNGGDQNGGAGNDSSNAPEASGQPNPRASAKPIENPSDAVFVAVSNPVSAANIAKALQEQGVTVPIALDPAALSPAFATALVTGGGAANSQLLTVGNDDGDALALKRDNLGRSMSAFLDGVRMSASQDSVQNLTGDAPFRADAWAADAKSHDAVIALAQACAQAKSQDPAKVAHQLGDLTLSAHDGLAGPTLAMSNHAPLQDSLLTLSASNQNLGLRPASEANPNVLWISDQTKSDQTK